MNNCRVCGVYSLEPRAECYCFRLNFLYIDIGLLGSAQTFYEPLEYRTNLDQNRSRSRPHEDPDMKKSEEISLTVECSTALEMSRETFSITLK